MVELKLFKLEKIIFLAQPTFSIQVGGTPGNEGKIENFEFLHFDLGCLSFSKIHTHTLGK